MRKMIALFIAMFAFSVAQAEVYQWVDGQGGVHFTDDLDKVPARYRKKVKTIESAAPGERPIPPAAAPAPVATPAPAEKKPELYNGRDQNWWSTAFSVARDELRTAREQLAGKQESLTALRRKRVIYQRTRDRIAYNELKEEIGRDEEKIKQLQEKLANLESEADRAGVPPEWRQ